MTYEFFPFLMQKFVSQQFWSNCNSSGMSVNRTNVCQGFLRSFSIFESHFVASFVDMFYPLCFQKVFRVMIPESLF